MGGSVTRYQQPEYQVGAQFLGVELPNANALTQGIVGDGQATMRGTDPAGYVRETLADYLGQNEAMVPGISGPTQGLTDSLGKVGRGAAFSLLGLVVLAFGLWVMVKQ